jgi:hypothetical protein
VAIFNVKRQSGCMEDSTSAPPPLYEAFAGYSWNIPTLLPQSFVTLDVALKMTN